MNWRRCYVIGAPVAHSLSPKLHNALYLKLGIQDKYVFSALEVSEDNLADTISALSHNDTTRGISVTLPHKEKVLPLVDYLDVSALSAKAANTLVTRDGKISAYNTDILGIQNPLLKKTSIKNTQVLVIGAGGASRAAAAACTINGGLLTVMNRSRERGESLAAEFGGTYVPLQDDLRSYDVIIQTSSAGMSSTPGPLHSPLFRKGQIVFDLIYTPARTEFLIAAETQSSEIISGVEMFAHQAAAQFKLYTDIEAPLSLVESTLCEVLSSTKK